MTDGTTASRLPDGEYVLFNDPNAPLLERVNDLVSRLTLEEKVSQMVYTASAIERLGIPAYNWWNECLHGVGRAGLATVFPQAIGLASTWNTPFIHRVAESISDEARAKHHDAVRRGVRDIYTGLTMWSPNINIFRDPRWGRGQETYGEDPYLTAQLGVAFVTGLQGDDPRYLKVVATPKHYAVHSGPEHARHHFDARVSERDLRETYLPAFRACVQEGEASSVMGAYNRFEGDPCCASHRLLQDILRDEWDFNGYVVSDCGAISDIYLHHKVVDTAEEAAALAVDAGCDLNCGEAYSALIKAVDQAFISEDMIDRAVTRLFAARFRLGMFDPPEMVSYTSIPIDVVDSPGHRELALRAARESIVLLKNAGATLPLSKSLGTIAVIGPNADDANVLLGNYNGTPSHAVTPLEGIRAAVSPDTEVLYARGCDISDSSRDGFDAAVEAAHRADVVIAVVGLSQAIEGEEGQRDGVAKGQHSQGDRVDLNLPGVQEDLLKALHATGTPVIAVLINGSPISIGWADANLPAIIEAWYPGQAGGTAIAEVLFGDYNPAGRLPITFPRSVDQLPPFEDYDMAGRTYRYLTEPPLYEFGHGLSYTRFEYSNLQIAPAQIDARTEISISVDVRNVGERAGDEVVQLYVRDVDASVPVPARHLEGFQRITLQPGETQHVVFTLTPRQFSLIADNGRRLVEPGAFDVAVGGRQPGRDWSDQTPELVIGRFEVTGTSAEVDML